MKTKKLLSLLAAAAISTSSFAALAVTANAADTNRTYAGNASGAVSGADDYIKADEGARYHTEKRADSYTLDGSGVTDELKALYDTNNDGEIDDVYTSTYFDYIGKEVTVSVSVDLPVGSYTAYYGGVPGTISAVSASSAPEITFGIGGEIALHAGSNKDRFSVYPITFNLLEDYKGDIVFANAGGWLPDLCSIKIVGNDFKTQNDIIIAADITRNGRTNQDIYTSITATGNYENSGAAEFFGSELSLANVGNIELSYTDTTDHFYWDVTKAGTYEVGILGATTRQTKVTFINAEKSDSQIVTTDKYTSVATAEKAAGGTSSINFFTSQDTVTLEEGVYRVDIEKVDSYYTNFVAMALKEYVEPKPELDIKKAINQFDTIDTHAENPAKPYKATYTIANGSITVKGITWIFEHNSEGTENDQKKYFPISETTITPAPGGTASIVFGLVVTGTEDAFDDLLNVDCKLDYYVE